MSTNFRNPGLLAVTAGVGLAVIFAALGFTGVLGTQVGLGLAVAKGFTEAMGGRLAAEATPGGGLTMVITLPLSTGAPVDSPPGRAPFETQSALTGRSHRPPLARFEHVRFEQDTGQDTL